MTQIARQEARNNLDGHGEHVAVADNERVEGGGCFDQSVLMEGWFAVGAESGGVLVGANGRVRALVVLFCDLRHVTGGEVR